MISMFLCVGKMHKITQEPYFKLYAFITLHNEKLRLPYESYLHSMGIVYDEFVRFISFPEITILHNINSHRFYNICRSTKSHAHLIVNRKASSAISLYIRNIILKRYICIRYSNKKMLQIYMLSTYISSAFRSHLLGNKLVYKCHLL